MKKMMSFIKYDLKLLFRDLNTMLFAFLMPLGFYFLFSNMLQGMPVGDFSIQELLVPLYIIIIISNAVINVFGVMMAQAKETGNLQKYKFLGYSEFMYSLTLYIATVLFQIAVILLFLVFTYFYKGIVFPGSRICPIIIVLVLINLYQFAITYFLNSIIKKTTLYNSVALTFYLFQMFLGGLTFPMEMFPQVLRKVVYVINPIIYGRNALLEVWTKDHALLGTTVDLFILLGFTVVLLGAGKLLNVLNEKGKTQQPKVVTIVKAQ